MTEITDLRRKLKLVAVLTSLSFICLEILFRLIFAWKLHDPSVLSYPFGEEAQRIFSYANYLPAGSLEPQVELHGHRKYRSGRKKIFILGEDGMRTSMARINERGFRGNEINPEKKEGTKRVICLGEAATFGAFNSDEETWPAQLQTLLLNFGNYEVINMGVAESHIGQLKSILENEVIPLKPDYVFYYGGHNDVARYLFDGEMQIDPSRSILFSWEILRAFYYRKILDSRLGGSDNEAKVRHGAEELVTKIKNELEDAGKLVRASGGRFIFLWQPLATEEELEKYKDIRDYYHELKKSLDENKFEYSKINNLAFIHYGVFSKLVLANGSIFSPNQALTSEQSLYISHFHLSAEGNKKMATYVAGLIKNYPFY